MTRWAPWAIVATLVVFLALAAREVDKQNERIEELEAAVEGEVRASLDRIAGDVNARCGTIRRQFESEIELRELDRQVYKQAVVKLREELAACRVGARP